MVEERVEGREGRGKGEGGSMEENAKSEREVVEWVEGREKEGGEEGG